MKENESEIRVEAVETVKEEFQRISRDEVRKTFKEDEFEQYVTV